MSINSVMDRAEREARVDLKKAKAHPLWPQAVAFLAGWFTPSVQLQIRAVIAAQSPDWPAAYHSFWGMVVRNALREHGFGEQEFGVLNLDNIYIELKDVEDDLPPACDCPALPGTHRHLPSGPVAIE